MKEDFGGKVHFNIPVEECAQYEKYFCDFFSYSVAQCKAHMEFRVECKIND